MPLLACALLLWSSAATCAAAPKTPQPVKRLDLTQYGFPGYAANMMDAGGALLSAHFADSTHVLLTYSLRGLVERIKDDDPEDFDRAVAALLIELPSGKVVARARWHLHDHGQYLWALGQGRFLLRRESRLWTMAPLQNLGADDAFRESPFVDLHHELIDVVNPSVDGGLVTIETSTRVKIEPRKPGTPILLNAEDPTPAPKVETYHFLRVAGSGAAGDPVRAVSAGVAHVDAATLLPLSDRGYLYTSVESKDRWRLHFESYDGETRTLEYVDSSCTPHLQWIAPGQFVTFSCRGAEDRLMISSFDFVPRETWEEPLSGTNAYAHFRTSAQAGRFALSRVVSVVGAGGAQALATGLGSTVQEQFTAQEVRVYQAVSGDLLLKVSADPVLRTGQNFDLADDGRSLLIVHGGALEIYALPALSKADVKDLAEVAAKAPAEAKAERIELRKLLRAAMPKSPEAVIEPATATPEAAPSPAAVATQPTAVKDGDASPRKAPTLLGPGETLPK